MMAVGTWTLAEKSDYISLLSSSTYSATAYILVVAGVVVMVTGILGCCATFKERRNLLRVVSFAWLFYLGEASWLCCAPALFVCPRANITNVFSPWQQCCPCPRGQLLLQSIFFHPHKECAAWFKSKMCSCNT